MTDRLWRWVVGCMLVVATLGNAGSGATTAFAQWQVVAARAIPNRFVVVLRDDVVGASGVLMTADAVAADAPGVTVRQEYGDVFPGFSAEVPARATAALAANPAVVAVYPDYVVSIAAQELTT